MNIVTANQHNTSDRRGEPVRMIVIHVMEGHPLGTGQRFQEATLGASAHYGIGFDGSLWQYVPEELVAFHAGNSAINRCSIGIELEGFCDRLSIPEAQMQSLIALSAQICASHSIPISRTTIIGHNEVPDPGRPNLHGGASHHTDPGPLFPWTDFMSRLQEAQNGRIVE